MSNSEDSNQANEVEQLGSLSQYESGDLSRLVQKLQTEGGISNKQAIQQVINSIQANQAQAPSNLEQLATVAGMKKDEPFLEILEQPKSKGIRFRYKCEGRSAGSIPGESSTNEHKTFPQVKINNFKGPAAIVVVSCVTKDEPYRPHPHTLVGKECRKGVCTVKLKRSNVATFPNLGIQCVTKKEIKESLKEREQIRVDPYGTGYFDNLAKLSLNIVRLCFQAFLPDDSGNYTRIVPPVVSQCIFDKKAVNDLVICRLSKQSGLAKGGEEVFMLCDKVNKDDIQVRFFEEVDDETIWENYADFSQSDVHRQFAIVFKTPPYSKDQYIQRPVEVQMQLFRPSDEGTSEPKVFQYIPNDPDPEGILHKRKRKMNFTNFFMDSNVNTPAFSLLTDNIKEEPEPPNSSVLVKERLIAKATRGRKKAEATVTRNLPQYTSANTGVQQLPVTFTDTMIPQEIVIETTRFTPMDTKYSAQVTQESAVLTELGRPMNGTQMVTMASSEHNHHQHYVFPTALGQNGGDDGEDVMLEDLPVTRMIQDQLAKASGDPCMNDEQMSLPSLSNLPSMDMPQDLFRTFGNQDNKLQMDSSAPKESKLQTDSTHESQSSKTDDAPRASPRGRKGRK